MKLRQSLLGVLAISSLTVPAMAAPFQSATIRRIVEGKEVFIDKKPARIKQTADSGQELSTGKSRAELLFDRRALGFLGNNSLIKLGEECFRLDQGQVLINGPQSACLGSKVLGIRGTTYVLNALNEGGYRLSVLSGAATISEEGTTASDQIEPNILEQYPRLNPVIGFGSSAWGSNAGGNTLGQAAGLILGDASFFVPLSQSEGSKLLYNYSTASSNFDNAWGASTEFGYKWFDPNNRSINSLLVGYDGWETPGCFHSQLAIGGQWQKGRWQFGANGGIPVDSCDNNLGFAIGQIGIPVMDLGQQSVLLSLSPYVMHGIGNTYGGGRVGLNVPVGENVSLSAYGQYDELLDTVIGGQISYRFGTNGGFINDPNLQRQTPATPVPWQTSEFNSGRPVQLAVGGDVSVLGQSISAPANAPSNQLTQAKSGIEIQAGEEAVLDTNGGLISRNVMSQERFSQLVQDSMGGQNLLPESHVISLVYQQLYGLPNQELLSILGSDWLIASRRPYPRLRGANNLVVPDNKLPKKEEEEVVVVEEEEEKEEQTEPEPEPIVLNYVCRSFSGNPDMAYYTGGFMGGSLSQAVRFQTTSRASATCSGREAGSDGMEATTPDFL
jgi:hypothetical protein